MSTGDYEANIAAVVEEMEIEMKNSRLGLESFVKMLRKKNEKAESRKLLCLRCWTEFPDQSLLDTHEGHCSLPMYKLSRATRTIPDLWEEWTIGSPTCPSVEERDRVFGRRWRQTQAEAKYHGTRKVLIKEIRRRAMSTGDYEANIAAVVEEMEIEMKSSRMGFDSFAKVLRKKNGKDSS